MISEFIENNELGAFLFVPLCISSNGGLSLHLSPLPLLEGADEDTVMPGLGVGGRGLCMIT